MTEIRKYLYSLDFRVFVCSSRLRQAGKGLEIVWKKLVFYEISSKFAD